MEDKSELRVLTVEDDDFVREVIVAYLEDSGFIVLQAVNGKEGLDVFRREKPDLVLLDLRMPVMDGLEVLSVLSKEFPETPAIVVSGMGTIGDAIKALKLGAWDYIAKPIHDMGVLEHAVNKALERANLLSENRKYREHLEEEVKLRTKEIELRTLELEESSIVLKKEVAERKLAEEEVCKINLELTTLSDCIHAVVRATDENELINEICRIVVEVGGYKMAWVGFAEPANSALVNVVALKGLLKFDASSEGNNPIVKPTISAVRTGDIIIFDDIENNPAAISFREDAAKRGYKSSIALPLVVEDEILGALNIYSFEPDAFDTSEVIRLKGLSNDLAFGIMSLRTREERKRAGEALEESVNKLEAALEGTVRVVASTVEVRDPYTAGHQRRVAELAKAISVEIGFGEHQTNGVYMAGIVHDLGKIYVPAEILSKPSELSGIEFSLIKTHPQVGYDLLKTIEFPWPIAQIIHQHHEKIDGSGYPLGLSGDDILIEAKILTVADVVEAMASHRPYRPAKGVELALEYVGENSGILFDAEVVGTCLRLFNEKKFTFQ